MFTICFNLKVAVGFETEGQIMFSKRFDGKLTSCYFPLLAKVPIKMRKYGQQMRNAVA